MKHDHGPLGSLVSYVGHDGIRLDGMLFQAAEAVATVVHVHGSFGNFYQNPFVRTLARSLQSSRHNLFTINTSAHDGVCEGYFVDGRFMYIGASLTRFETCVGDLLGACAFADQLGVPLVLCGHSLGCDRVIWTAMQASMPHPLVLLAPCDSYQLQARLLHGESVEAQRERLRAQRPAHPDAAPDWLAPAEYGVRSTESWTYPNPITREPFLSISEGAPYRLFRYDQTPTWRLPNPTLVITPENDALLTCSTNDVAKFFQVALSTVQHRCVPGDHLFSGTEQRLADAILRWLNAAH